MKKKLHIGVFVLLIVVILGSFLYVGIGKNNIENKMWNYLSIRRNLQNPTHGLSEIIISHK